MSGVKHDTGKPLAGILYEGFPNALLEVAKVGTFGAKKYSRGNWLHVDGGILRYTDALHRHQLLEQCGELVDEESQLLHAAHAAWNSLARLELLIREKNNAIRQQASPIQETVGTRESP